MSHVFPRHTRTAVASPVRGEGCYIYDAAGKAYFDGSGGAAVSCLGHGDPEIVQAIQDQVAALAYAGSAIGAVFAGDLVTLFIYWEGTAIASVFLIWARRTEGAFYTGLRYLVIQIASDVILLAGVVLLYRRQSG